MRSLSTSARSIVGGVCAGNMGRGIAASLARGGQTVLQYDAHAPALASSVAQHDSIAGAGSLSELCARASTVVVSVAGEAAERAVFLEDGALINRAPAGTLLVGCGTVTVDLAREVHAAAAARGVLYLDAPVSGGPEGPAHVGAIPCCPNSEFP